jgi:hypothetical protein
MPGVLFRDRVQRVALRRRRVLADIDGLTSRLPQRLVRFWLELDGFLVMVQRTRRVHRRMVTIAHGDVIGRRLCGGSGGKRGDRDRGDPEGAAWPYEGREHGQDSGMQVSGHPRDTPQGGQCSRCG